MVDTPELSNTERDLESKDWTFNSYSGSKIGFKEDPSVRLYNPHFPSYVWLTPPRPLRETKKTLKEKSRSPDIIKNQRSGVSVSIVEAENRTDRDDPEGDTK